MQRLLFWVFAIGIAELGLAQNLAQSLINGAWSGQPAAVRGALASGRVDVNLTTPDGDTPLMLASLAGHDNIIDILLEGGADPNLANKAGETALILASKYGFNNVATKLIEAGAGVNAHDLSDRSAWTWASWGGNASLQSVLKASGADESGKVDPFDDAAPIDRYETRPQKTKGKVPKIPKALREAGVAGTVQLRVVVGRDGKTQSVELLEGLADELDQELLEQAQKWKFSPGEIQNKPVVGVVTVKIDYPAGGGREGHLMTWTLRWRN